MNKFENMVNYVNEVYQWWKDYEDTVTPKPVKTVIDKIFDKDGNALNIEFSFKYGDEDTRTGDEQLFQVFFRPQGDYVLTGNTINQLISEIKSLSSNDWLAFEPERVVYDLTVISEEKRTKEDDITGLVHDINFMFRNDIVTAGIITDHIHKMMYTKYDYPTWREYFAKATVNNKDSRSKVPHIRSGYELRLHDATKDPGLDSFWIFESSIYDKPRCEDLAKEIRKHLAKSQLHQDFEKVETSVDVRPSESEKECSPHVTIWIDAIKPKPSFKFKHNLTKLTDLSSMSDYDSVRLGATGMLLNAIRERDEKIAAKEARKRAEQEAEIARIKAIKDANRKNYEEFKNFVNEIGDFELNEGHCTSFGDGGWKPLRDFAFTWNNDDNCSYLRCDGIEFSFYHESDLHWHKNEVVRWAVENGVRAPQQACV
jgi:hypothetical protein